LLIKQIGNYKYFCNKYNENGEPIGIIVHKSIFPIFFIFYKGLRQDYISIVCKKSFFDELSKDNNVKENIILDNDFIPRDCRKRDNNKIDYITKSGEYGYFQYNTREVNLQEMSSHTELSFYPKQKSLFEDIMTFYKSNHFCKVYLSGPPGSGKTYFGYLMAQKLNCYLCDVYKGNEPSSNFNEIYTQIKISSERPFVVIFDEVDILISEIHLNSNDHHKKYSKEIYDKTSWNSFMDKIEYGMYPHMILLMTSNKKKQEIDKYDKSYLRNGRVNVIKEW
tara:strand:+ start:207 stop:1043 length:837 start_codon:yes stop_codon:yes gene_type:complete